MAGGDKGVNARGGYGGHSDSNCAGKGLAVQGCCKGSRQGEKSRYQAFIQSLCIRQGQLLHVAGYCRVTAQKDKPTAKRQQ